MLRRAISLLPVVGMLLAAGACDQLTSTSNSGSPVMLVTLNARTKGAGFTTNPVGNFYSVSSATFSSAGSANDSCSALAYDPNAVPGPITATAIGGGAFVAVQVSAHADTLRKVSTTDLTYRLSTTAGLPFTPGDTITFVIPGDVTGFPPATLQGRTAEPFTLNPIVVPSSGPMTLSWTAASDGNAAMLISLRYNNGSGTGLNAQIFCDFKDGGTGTVPAALTTLWAGSGMRDVLAQRLRTALLSVGGVTTSYFNMISTFDVPTPVSP
jgi:hypothetical protein